ncbi:NmrA family transcriptional regulator [Burkholderia gladioli]|uniref:SDR family oxidoreductase n=1 Tax=Burkholderia gladioli TaxID=28095 RepID=UPI00050EBC10|nr:NmrA/HSCARG family protein [Burkholderia gladioli]KGE06572.1 NmrA family transcriptional regulator [Burkholderia gladioli]MDN7466118.1 NmrA/HSCARG family protein [Burkholderia gladioli]
MTILVTGATGRVGRHVVAQLSQRGATVRVLTRDPAKANFAPDVEVAKGDLLDLDSLREAFSGVKTLFLLNAVTGDEFTQAIITLNIAREAGIDRVVYLSVFDADHAVNVPHFAVKYGAERMLQAMGFSATILRPTYFIDNEVMIQDIVKNYGVYPMPIGSKGVAMADARDIGEVAAIELIRRDQAPGKLPIETINIVGPDALTGTDAAAIWSEVLGRPITYGGDDPSGFEANMANFMPKWMAYEMRVMAERYVSDGMVPQEGDRERLISILGRPLRSYRDFVAALGS